MSEEIEEVSCPFCGEPVKELQPSWLGMEGKSHLWCALDKSGDAERWQNGGTKR